MGKRSRLQDDSGAQEAENRTSKKLKTEKREKKEKKDKKDKKEKKDKKQKKEKGEKKHTHEKADKVEESEKVEEKEVKPAKTFAIHDLISVERSISLVQENLAKIMEITPTAEELSQYVQHLLKSSDNGSTHDSGVTAKILLLSKSHKIQLAAQLKTLYQAKKLKIFDQIINFSETTILNSADDVQLLLKERNRKAHENGANTEKRFNENSILPELPVLYDSVLEAKVFIHKSATNNDMHSSKYDQVQWNNERLEYLGDAVLETIVSDITEARYPDFDEGQLTVLRATLVKNETIEVLSRAYKFPERQQELLKFHVIKTDLNIDSKLGANKRIADLFEAYIGAIFIDKGRDGNAYDFIKSWLIAVYEPILNEFESIDQLKYLHLSSGLVSELLGNDVRVKHSPDVKDGVMEVKETKVAQQQEPVQKFPITITSTEPIDKLARGNLYALIGSAKLHPIFTPVRSYQSTGTHCVVNCTMDGELLGIGEGRNAKDASARAAMAALLNKELIEKYHLIRMMTPRTESVVKTPEVDQKAVKKARASSVLQIPHFIAHADLPTPDVSAKANLLSLLSEEKVLAEVKCEPDHTSQSILPMFKTILKVNGKNVCDCVEASKKKGANKVAQWLLDEIDRHGKQAVLKDLE
ncbi:hypothetical protein PMKS-003923 [Pichia membranifaciens]|uniref:RNase III domain-containing protein n=1 Tax=Pichia membranifaciens TaxID=4926 RepID=A0A1Q2YLI8_9ASCO|nr:hypothetical protein PMKS-003923 [Pichia membranifaciens]